MKKLLLIICVLLSVNIITDDAIAGNNPSQVTGILNNIGQGGGAPECDWSAIKDSLFETESSGSGGYTAVGPETRYGYPLGKYQFIADTQNNITSQFPNCNGDACRNNNPFCGGSRASCASQPLLQEACHGVQDCLMDGLLQTNLQAIQNDSSCQQLLANGGQEISGCGQGRCLTCRATESGLLAAFHLGGPDECANILRNGSGDSDNTGTSTAYYVCRHGGLAVPGNCTPADYGFTGSVDPYSGSPVLTAQQLEIREAQGDPITFGFGGLRYGWVASFQLMTNQLHTTMIQQMQVIGSFLDAKHQLETQRLFQEMTADAHKKYHPSEQMCKIGTFTRNLGESERRAHLTQRAMASSIIDREMKTGDPSTITIGSDDRTRMLSYLQSFCDPSDNSGQMEVICQDSAASVNAAGLRAAASAARFQANQAAQTASTNPSTANNTAADTADALATQAEEEATAAENAIADLRNADINFTETISMPLTFDLNLLDGETTADETSLFAFLDQIFMHRSMPWISEAKTKLASFIDPYLEMRSLMAMRSVAQNSFSYIISEKTAGTDNPDDSIAPFLRSMMVEMGINIDEINQMIGENPSYYAQMEFLTRKIYYHPEFVSNLYDKPANVKRIAAALTAIKSMQNWQISQALKRREMLFSILLEIQLRDKQNDMETLDIPLARGTFSGSRSDSNVIYTAGGTNSGTPNSGSGNGDGDADGNGSGDGAGDGDAADAAGNASPNSDLTLGEQLQQYGYGQEIARIMTDPNRTPISIGDAAIDAGMDVIYGEYHSEAGDTFYDIEQLVRNASDGQIEGILLEYPPGMQEIFTPDYLRNNTIEDFARDWGNALIDDDISAAQTLLDQGVISQEYFDEYTAELESFRNIPYSELDEDQRNGINSLYRMASAADDRDIPVIANDVDPERAVTIDVTNRIVSRISSDRALQSRLQGASEAEQLAILDDLVRETSGISSYEELLRIEDQSMNDRSDVQAAQDAGINLDSDGSLIIHRGLAHIDGSSDIPRDTPNPNEYDDLLEERGRDVVTIEIAPEEGQQNRRENLENGTGPSDRTDFTVRITPEGNRVLDRSEYPPSTFTLPPLNFGNQ